MSTVVPTPFMGIDSLDKTRFRFYCIDIFHFKIRLLLPLSTSSHHPLSLISFSPISCRMFFPILHTSSHSTSETLLCVLGCLGLICWSYFCLYILLSVIWPGLRKKGTTSWFELIGLHWTGIVVLSTVVPMSLVGVDSLNKTRFRFYCIDIYHFKIVSSYLPLPPVNNHFLLSPSTISHLQLLGVMCWCYFCLYMLLIVVCPGLGRKKHLDLHWLICIKLGSWSCQLWHQHPLWVLTLLTKQDSGFVALTSIISKFVSCYLPSPLVITHLLLSPSTISHLQLLGVIFWCYFCL